MGVTIKRALVYLTLNNHWEQEPRIGPGSPLASQKTRDSVVTLGAPSDPHSVLKKDLPHSLLQSLLSFLLSPDWGALDPLPDWLVVRVLIGFYRGSLLTNHVPRALSGWSVASTNHGSG